MSFSKVYAQLNDWRKVVLLVSISTIFIQVSLYILWHLHPSVRATEQPYPQHIGILGGHDLTITTYQGEVDNGRFRCDHIMMHSANLDYESSSSVWLKRHKEFMSYFPKDCFVFVRGDPARMPTYLAAHRDLVSRQAWNEMGRRNNGKRIRYDAGVYFTQLALNGLIRRISDDGIPWLLYTDIDVIFTNKSRGISSILQRLDEGLKLGRTTEDRVCGNPDMFPCVPSQPKVSNLSRDDIILVIALDNDCQTTWMLNSGSQLWQLGLSHGWFMEADLTLFNDTTLLYSFDHFEQGKVALLIREAFDLDFNRIRALCAPFEASVWMPSIEKNEIMILRELNYTKASNHNVLGGITHKWFPNGIPPNVPRYVALVNPRWLNSFACRYNWGFSEARIEATVLHCGDFMGHFNGCGKSEWKFRSLRELLGATPECRADLPFLTMDESDEPFDYDKWVAEGTAPFIQRWHGEPRERIQMDY